VEVRVARVVVAMSGGVDSSVAAGLLVEQGHDVIGVHMKLHDAAPGSEPGTCCGLDDAVDARRVADHLGIPFYVVNLRQAFQKAVMDDLTDTYLAGRTPNPCIQCNGVLKFQVLLSRALALGASHLATGHYARIGEGPVLRRAVDEAKDQTYFLFPMTSKALSRTLFPLGDLDKDQVRAHAARMGLLTADKPESQDVCFLPDNDHARFIAEQRPDVDTAGEIVDEAGRVLGYHDGYVRFTVGQRRGLGVALGVPGYVLRIEPDTRRVVVAPRHRLEHRGLVASRAVWTERPAPGRPLQARIRHRGGMIPCRVGAGDDSFRVDFAKPALAVAPGQAVVFYDGDRVLGGAWIDEAIDAWLPEHRLVDRGAAAPLPQAPDLSS
jgi:tRNA-specific 2-thiouridylase